MVHVMVYSPNTDFFNIVHLSAIARHVNCTFLHCFYTYLQLEMAISVFILIFAHVFCLCMFLINHGCSDVACQMSCLLPWVGISLIWFKNHFLQYVYFCILQKHFFQHHEFCRNWEPYDISIFLSLLYTFLCIHAYICLHFHIFTYFLSENAWNREWVKWYCMTDETPHISLQVTVTFLLGGHHPQDVT